MAADPYSAIIGTGIGTIGALLGSGEARKRRNQLTDLANTPGLDIDTEIANALAGYEKSLPGASSVSSGVNQANAANLRALLETGIPGYGDLQKQILANIGAEARGELSPETQAILARSNAAKTLGGGYGGSQAGLFREARQLGRAGQDLQTQATKDYLAVLAGTPTPGLFGTQSLLGPTISDRIGIRSNERTQRLGILTGAIQSPTDLESIAKFLQQTGGALAGTGLTGGFGGGFNFSSNPGLNVQQGGGAYSSSFGGGP